MHIVNILFFNGWEIGWEKSWEKSWEKILNAIQSNPAITTDELAEIVGISAKGVEYHLAKLKKDKVLARKGARKDGLWVILKDV